MPILVPTDINDSDMLTKVLEPTVFHKHRAVMMNLAGQTSDRPTSISNVAGVYNQFADIDDVWSSLNETSIVPVAHRNACNVTFMRPSAERGGN